MKRSEEIRVIIKLKEQQKEILEKQTVQKIEFINEDLQYLRFELAALIDGRWPDETITL
jgi:division protein CdvB (Snf7/Vps24/ESCRT-III family)